MGQKFTGASGISDATTGESVGVTDGALNVNIFNQLVPERYDEIALVYTGDNVTTVTYLLDSVLVATLTLAYTGENLTNVTKT